MVRSAMHSVHQSLTPYFCDKATDTVRKLPSICSNSVPMPIQWFNSGSKFQLMVPIGLALIYFSFSIDPAFQLRARRQGISGNHCWLILEERWSTLAKVGNFGRASQLQMVFGNGIVGFQQGEINQQDLIRKFARTIEHLPSNRYIH